MNSKVKAGILAAWLLLGVWGISCSQGYSSSASQPTPNTTQAPPPAAPSTPSAPSTPQPSTSNQGQTGAELIITGQRTQSHEGNKVTIQAAPREKLVAGNRELTFSIEMDTHSVNLDAYDLKGLATLRDSQGREFKAISWQAPPGGHHRSGVLTFGSDQPLLQPDTKYIELSLKNIANIPERVLRWELRQAAS